MILFHPKKNVGRKVTITGREREIDTVTKDLQRIRLVDEKYSIVNEYAINEVESAPVLTISLNDGKSWIDIPVTPDSDL